MQGTIFPMIRRLLLLIGLLAPLAPGQSAIHDETGLTALIKRLGPGNQPSGANVPVGQAEAYFSNGYAPDFGDPQFMGKTFVLKSGPSTPSGHATLVGWYLYGTSTGISPGIAQVECYEASNWLGPGFLNGTGATPPKLATVKIFNNSWVGSGGGTNVWLRKLDYAIATQQLVVCNGVNNGTGPLDYPLLSHSFNAIAVGRSDGLHKAGTTFAALDGPGRQKPELVAPGPATSFATPLVAGAASLLVETARTDPALSVDPDAERADLLKAVLMAGAKHRPGWSNGAPASGPLRGSTSQPLDPLNGADQIHVDRSHWILTGGAQPSGSSTPAAPVARHAGWSEAIIGASQSRWWRFEVEARKGFVSVIATWNREVAASFGAWSMPDLDLELWRLDAAGIPQSLVGDPGIPYFAAGNVQSTSPVDNVEHLFIHGLRPGSYALELRRGVDLLADWRVGVAWQLYCPEPRLYGSAKTSSLGTAPLLDARGIPSAAVNDFRLEVSDAVPGASAVLFFGSTPASIPFYGGTLLVQPPITRLPPTTLDGAGAASLALSITPAMVGTTLDYQLWFRDPAHPDGTGVGLTNAVEVPFCP
jgi:hypothetical protein